MLVTLVVRVLLVFAEVLAACVEKQVLRCAQDDKV